MLPITVKERFDFPDALSSMFRNCPECAASVQTGARLCKCGHNFELDLLSLQDTHSSLEIVRVHRKQMARKFLVIAGILVPVAVVVVYFSGIMRASENFSGIEEPNQPTQINLAGVNENPAPENLVPVDGGSYRVAKVYTGDILDVTDEKGREYRVHIHGIRAPKMDEMFGNESRQNLSNLILGKTVIIRSRNADAEGNFVAEVMIGATNTGIAQTQSGLVWLETAELTEQSELSRRQYLNAELSAKTQRYGIWSVGTQTPAVSEVAAAEAAPVYSDPAAMNVPPMAQPNLPVPLRQPNVTRPPNQQNARSTGVTQVPVPQAPVVNTTKKTESIEKPSAGNAAKPAPSVEAKQTEQRSEIKYFLGPRGGCYYISPSGNKRYVDRAMCN